MSALSWITLSTVVWLVAFVVVVALGMAAHRGDRVVEPARAEPIARTPLRVVGANKPDLGRGESAYDQLAGRPTG